MPLLSRTSQCLIDCYIFLKIETLEMSKGLQLNNCHWPVARAKLKYVHFWFSGWRTWQNTLEGSACLNKVEQSSTSPTQERTHEKKSGGSLRSSTWSREGATASWGTAFNVVKFRKGKTFAPVKVGLGPLDAWNKVKRRWLKASLGFVHATVVSRVKGGSKLSAQPWKLYLSNAFLFLQRSTTGRTRWVAQGQRRWALLISNFKLILRALLPQNKSAPIIWASAQNSGSVDVFWQVKIVQN